MKRMLRFVLVGFFTAISLSTACGQSINEFEASIAQLISDGKQSKAEDLIDKAPTELRNYQRFRLIQACLVRSRFDIENSTKQFNDVILIYPYNDDGYLAYLVKDLDTRGFRQVTWDELKKLSENSKLGLWPKWMLGVEARNFNRNQEGKLIYENLLSTQRVGSSLMHQTFANILDELGLYEEALKHRRVAVNLEDRGWSRDGLANTLSNLNQNEEAIENYKKALEFSPRNSNTMINYSILLQRLKKFDEALELLRTASTISPDCDKIWYNIGLCLRTLGRPDEAQGAFKKALELNPNNSLTKAALDGKR